MTTGRSAMQEVAPKMAEIAADVLFGDIWERPGLSKRCLLYTSDAADE